MIIEIIKDSLGEIFIEKSSLASLRTGGEDITVLREERRVLEWKLTLINY